MNTPLVLHRAEPDADVVRHLHELLAEAEAGRITAIMTFYVSGKDNKMGGRRSGCWNKPEEVIGAMEMTKLDFYSLIRSK